LIAWFGGTPLELPETHAAAPAGEGPGRGAGTVTVNFERGELLLEDREGGAHRLVWDGSQEPAGRSLPAGTYVLRTYRVVREAGGRTWHVSATKPSIRELRVRPGKTSRVELDLAIRMEASLVGRQARMSIRGDEDAGLSIYADGRRIPMGFRVLGRDGETLVEGEMEYG